MLFQKIHKPQPTNPLYDTNILIFSLLPTITNYSQHSFAISLAYRQSFT